MCQVIKMFTHSPVDCHSASRKSCIAAALCCRQPAPGTLSCELSPFMLAGFRWAASTPSQLPLSLLSLGCCTAAAVCILHPRRLGSKLKACICCDPAFCVATSGCNLQARRSGRYSEVHSNAICNASCRFTIMTACCTVLTATTMLLSYVFQAVGACCGHRRHPCQ